MKPEFRTSLPTSKSILIPIYSPSFPLSLSPSLLFSLSAGYGTLGLRNAGQMLFPYSYLRPPPQPLSSPFKNMYSFWGGGEVVLCRSEWRPGVNLQETVFSFHHVGLGIEPKSSGLAAPSQLPTFSLKKRQKSKLESPYIPAVTPATYPAQITRNSGEFSLSGIGMDTKYCLR